jgi:uncharacterized DUF497 family protein
MPLLIEFDPDKDARNLRLRGISLARAETLLQGFVVDRVDDRRDYGETRIVVIGEIAGVEFTCVYTRRGDAIRPISLRRASRKERDVYHEAKAAAARGEKA